MGLDASKLTGALLRCHNAPTTLNQPAIARKPAQEASEPEKRYDHQADSPSPRAEPEQTVRLEPLETNGGKEGHAGRVTVSVCSFRRRLIDPDNLCPKFFIDALRYEGIIRDDTAADIEFSVRQIKVAKKDEEKTEIVLVYSTAS